MSLSEFFKDGEITDYIQSKIKDPWVDTVFEGYSWLANTQMGSVGEKLTSKFMLKNGSKIRGRENRGHDRIIDGYKTEIKFSLSVTDKKFKFNHLSCEKDWDRIILFGVNNINEYYIYWATKQDFVNHINSKENIFERQQGGKDGNNDDYMYSKDIDLLYSTGLVHDISVWLKDGCKKEGLELWMSE